MKSSLRNIGGYLFTILGSVGLLYLLLGKRLFTLGMQMLVKGGDPLKNIFTPAYLYKWDDGVWHTAMNYPYGDFAIYTDAQVGLVMILRLLRAIGIDSEHHLLLIIQGLPILSFVIAAALLYKLARYFDMPIWWSVVISLSCTAFSPQILRHTGHYGLSYAFIIPAYWLYLIHSPSWRRWVTVLVGATGLILSAYLHPYWILILTVFTMSYVVTNYCFSKEVRWLPLLISIASIGTVLLINTMLDPVVDRPEHPYGFLAYNTQIRSLFSPYGFMYDLVIPLLSSRAPDYEGYAYMGPMLYALIFGFLLILLLKRQRWQTLKQLGVPKELRIYFTASLLVLLFAMGLHVHIGNGIITEWISPLRQFRSLGRFAWVFSYVGAIWAGVVTFHLLRQLPWQWLRVVAYLAIITLITAESSQWLSHRGKQINKWAANTNWLESEQTLTKMLTANNRRPGDYQAIITFPPAVEGSEKLGRGPGYDTRRHVLPFVYQTGVPTTISSMSRTSLTQALKLLQIGSGKHVDKRWAKDLTSDKPILLALEPVDTLPFGDLLVGATRLGMEDKIALYETDVAHWKTVEYLYADSLTITTDQAGYVSNAVEEGVAEGIFGTRGVQMDAEEYLLVTCPVDIDTTTTAQASAWFRIEPHDRNIARIQFAAYNAAGDQLWKHAIRYAEDHRYEIHGEWYRINDIRTITKDIKTLKLFATGEGVQVDQGLITVDSLQPVIPVTEDYWQVGHSIYPLAK